MFGLKLMSIRKNEFGRMPDTEAGVGRSTLALLFTVAPVRIVELSHNRNPPPFDLKVNVIRVG